MKCTVILMCICVLFSCDVWGQTHLSGNVCAEVDDDGVEIINITKKSF